ncbi:melanoma cell adhesion molecule b isoform X1 [Dicentrarchus labrax]|nr:melanoma cell adhesion molecule b isoform X1 [Dicentrarchus labrax]
MAVRDAASPLVGLVVLFLTWGVWADVEVNMEGRVEVYRGDTAQIACMFSSSEGIGGLIIQWYYVTRLGEKQKIIYQDSTGVYVEQGTVFTDRISMNDTGATKQVVLSISNVQVHDEVEFICFIDSIGEGDGEGRTKLKVFEIPENPTIEAVGTGISSNQNSLSKIGTCQVKNGFPKPNITWYRNNTPLRNVHDEVKVETSTTTESSHLFSVKSELSLKVVKEDKDVLFYCQITYFVPGGLKMTETDRINVTVFYPSTAVNVWVESPKGKIKEGDTIELHCRGNGNNPSEISISHEGSGKSWDTEMLVLENVTLINSGVYQCTSLDMETLHDISGNTTVFVNYLHPAEVKPEGTYEMAQGNELTATCNALSSLQTHTAWFKNGKEVSKNHTLMLKDATYDTAGAYVCVVTVPEIEGMETSGTLLVYVQGQPKIMEAENTEIEENFEKTVNLTCNARGFPAPKVIWTTSDGKVLHASQRETEEGVHSVVTVKVTSDITVFCNASNEHGTDAVTFNIKATIITTTTTTTPAPTTTPTTTSSTSTITTTTTPTISISSSTVKAETALPPKKIKKEGSGVIIAVIIICILLLAILGSVLYFLYKKGKICGRSGKQDLTKEKSNKDNIVVEMKSDNTEEAVLLGVNGEKQPPSDQ